MRAGFVACGESMCCFMESETEAKVSCSGGGASYLL